MTRLAPLRFTPRAFVALLLALLGGLLTVSAYQPVLAQTFAPEVRLHVGFANAGLDDMRDWQNAQRGLYLQDDIPVEAVESFPRRPSVRLDAALVTVAGVRLGLAAGYASTGGRLHYGDYSGEVRFDQTISRLHGDLFAERPVPVGARRLRLAVVPGVRGRVSQTSAEVESLVRLGEDQATERIDLDARGYSLMPQVALSITRGVLTARLEGGYEHTFGGGLEQDGNAIRLDGSDDDLRADWSGLRGGITLGVRLH